MQRSLHGCWISDRATAIMPGMKKTAGLALQEAHEIFIRLSM